MGRSITPAISMRRLLSAATFVYMLMVDQHGRGLSYSTTFFGDTGPYFRREEIGHRV
jgi:hypothetical protein